MILSIEGNIGTGKTSFLEYLEKNPEYIVLYEPVDEWMSLKDNDTQQSIFETYYGDRKRNGFLFQIMALQTRFENLVNMSRKHKNRIIFCERSIFTGLHIFAKLAREQNNLTDMEMQIYTKCHNFMCDLINDVDIVGMIYLKASPETCMTRIKKRNRSGEENIPIDYVRSLHDAHEDWLMSPQQSVLVLDAEESLRTEKVMESIKTFIASKLPAAIK
jgi:deoxyadenosine/deoxycytidine kinase